MEEGFKIPIVLLIYNRSKPLIEMMQKLAIVKPNTLYIVADGPKYEDQKSLCFEARDIVESGINWKCNIRKNYSIQNMGCALRVSSGLDWVFSNEEYAIILEDDCIPSLSFFPFCEELLLKYLNDTRIMHICGSRWNLERMRSENSYFFSKYSHIWGWATWKRAWKLYDFNLKIWPQIKKNNLLNSIFWNKNEANYWTKIFDLYYYSIVKSGWATQWFYSININNGLAIMPNRNLISNIGNDGTHGISLSEYYKRDVDEAFRITSHPELIVADRWFDNYHFKNHIVKNRRVFKRTKRFIYRAIKKFFLTRNQ